MKKALLLAKITQLVRSTVAMAGITFIVSALLFTSLALLVQYKITDTFDTATLLWINQQAAPWLDNFFRVFTELGGVIGIAMLTLVAVALLVYKKLYSKALIVGLVVVGAAVMNIVFKSMFERSRPDLWEWVVAETFHSFPSGHATASMALAFCVVLLFWRTKWRTLTIILATAYVGLIGVSRLYLGVHFPTDIVGGWLLGAGWASLIVVTVYTMLKPARTVTKDTTV